MPAVIIINDMPIHKNTQRRAGTPVAAAMFAASEDAPLAETTNRALRLKSALRRHWTARNASAKFTHFNVAYLATASSPTVSTAPENIVKKTLPTVTFARK